MPAPPPGTRTMKPDRNDHVVNLNLYGRSMTVYDRPYIARLQNRPRLRFQVLATSSREAISRAAALDPAQRTARPAWRRRRRNAGSRVVELSSRPPMLKTTI